MEVNEIDEGVFVQHAITCEYESLRALLSIITDRPWVDTWEVSRWIRDNWHWLEKYTTLLPYRRGEDVHVEANIMGYKFYSTPMAACHETFLRKYR